MAQGSAPDEGILRVMAQAVSAVVTRARLAGSAGLSFDGKRDLFKILGYHKDITPANYRDRFERNGIATRIVEAMPKATWHGSPEIIEDEDPEVTTEFEQTIIDFNKRLKLWAIMRRADILSGITRYGVILIGAPGKFNEPIERLSSLDEIIYLTPWSEEDVVIKDFVDDEESPRFGLPESYNFTRTKGADVRQAPKIVHHTRVLHIADGVLDEQIFGQPRMKKVWNNLDDLEKVSGGGAEAFFQRVHPGLQIDVDKDIEMDDKDFENLEGEIETYMHTMRRYFKTRGVTVNPLNAGVSNFNNPVDAILTLIAGSTEIPKRILIGSEAAHLASTQDRTNWHEKIEDRREQFAEPFVIRPFIDRLMEWGALPKVEDYEVRWPEMQNLDESERAEVAVKLDKVSDKVITKAEVRDRILKLPPLDEGQQEDIALQEEDDKLQQILDGMPNPVVEDPNPVEDPEKDKKEPTGAARDVDKEPNREPWQDIHRVADRNRIDFSKAFVAAVRAAKAEAPLAEIRGAVRRNDVEGLENIKFRVSKIFEDKATELLVPLLIKTLNTAGRVATSTAKTEGTLRVAQVVLSFEIASPEAIKWAQERSAALVTGITDTTRRAISDAVAVGLDQGGTIAGTSRAIRNVIGLTPRDARSVMLAADGLDSKGLDRLSGTLLRRRASNISRTETIAASNRGQQEFWNQAEESGFLAHEDAFQEWIVTPDDRLCPICEPMGGQVVGLKSPFETGEGDQVLSPPAHPSCRCAVGLASAPEVKKVAQPDQSPEFSPSDRGSISEEAFTGLEPSTANSLALEEQRIAANSFETSTAINPRTGENILSIAGNSDTVEFTGSQIRSIRDSVLTHNHPGGLTFSVDDIAFSAFSDLAEMRVVTPERHVYRMLRPAKGWPPEKRILSVFKKAVEDRSIRFPQPLSITNRVGSEPFINIGYRTNVANALQKLNIEFQFIPGVV